MLNYCYILPLTFLFLLVFNESQKSKKHLCLNLNELQSFELSQKYART